MGAGGPYRELRHNSHAPCPQLRLRAEHARWRSWVARQRFERWFAETYEKYRCIHEHEADWRDPNPDYWGGLQMDLSFQRSHGPQFLKRWGTADKWPIWAQLLAAEDAYETRGFGPWPTWWRYCA
jgi:hypothetical protein